MYIVLYCCFSVWQPEIISSGVILGSMVHVRYLLREPTEQPTNPHSPGLGTVSDAWVHAGPEKFPSFCPAPNNFLVTR